MHLVAEIIFIFLIVYLTGSSSFQTIVNRFFELNKFLVRISHLRISTYPELIFSKQIQNQKCIRILFSQEISSVSICCLNCCAYSLRCHLKWHVMKCIILCTGCCRNCHKLLVCHFCNTKFF